MATEMKKTAKKVAKEVSYERVTSKKGFFSVTIKGEVVLWAVRDGGNYLYYVINEAKREIGERYLWKLISNEEAEKKAIEEVQRVKQYKKSGVVDVNEVVDMLVTFKDKERNEEIAGKIFPEDCLECETLDDLRRIATFYVEYHDTNKQPDPNNIELISIEGLSPESFLILAKKKRTSWRKSWEQLDKRLKKCGVEKVLNRSWYEMWKLDSEEGYIYWLNGHGLGALSLEKHHFIDYRNFLASGLAFTSYEEAAKVDDWMISVIKKANSRYGGIGVAPYVQLIGDPHDYCWGDHVQSFYPMCGDCVQIDLDWEYEYSEDYFINENALSTVLAAVNKKLFGEHRIIFESIFA